MGNDFPLDPILLGREAKSRGVGLVQHCICGREPVDAVPVDVEINILEGKGGIVGLVGVFSWAEEKVESQAGHVGDCGDVLHGRGRSIRDS